MFMHKLSYKVLLFSLSVASAMTAGAAPLQGKWQNHPSFYQVPQQLIDGENITYFLLHQQQYMPTAADYTKNTASLFRYDKLNPSEGITALANTYQFFPEVIRTMTYSPSQKMLIVAGEDGSIWGVPDKGDPFSVIGLGNTTLPGKHHVNSITENREDGTFWIAATWGYAQFDPSRKNIEKVVRTTYPVEWISQVGGDLIIFSNGKAYTASPADYPSSIEMLSILPVDVASLPAYMNDGNSLKSPVNLMPLTSKTFAFLAPHSTSATGSTIATATKVGSEWKVVTLAEDEVRSLTDGQSPTLKTSNNGIPNRDGYYVHSHNNAYQLVRGVDPDFNNTNEYLSKVLKTQTKGVDTWRESTSWDMENFWFFLPKQGFYSKKVNSNNWTATSENIWPSAPTPYIATYMAWHPDLGMIINNHGIDSHFNQNAPSVPWLMSAYKSGKWTQLTPAFFPPEEFMANDTYKNTFNTNIESYPVNHPDGLAIDPANPKYVYAGSMTSGWARINLEDLSEVPLHVGTSRNKFVSMPGFIDDFPVFSAWTSVCDLSAPQFDSDGNMWMLLYDVDKSAASEPATVLYCYTAEDLKVMENANVNPSAYRKPHTIEVKVGVSSTVNGQLVALKSASNKNIVAFHTGYYGSPLFLYDHNGTPGDTSDDKFVALKDFVDAETGSPILLGTPKTLWEDPTTGNVWMSTDNGTFIADTELAFTQPEKAVTRKKVKSGTTGKTTLFETSVVNGCAVDALGNLWIATNNSGIYCISADGNELLGEFNVTNSPLPANRVYSVGYNPENMSLMLSTDGGIIEFFPEMLGAAAEERVRMSPSNITPSFRGWVTFSGLPSGKDFMIVSETGEPVSNLGTPVNGVLQWNVEDSSGERPSTGTYRLRNAETDYITFHLLN